MILDNDVRKDDDLVDTDKAKKQTADGGKCVDEQLWRKAGCSAGGHSRLSSTWNAAKVNNPTPHQHTKQQQSSKNMINTNPGIKQPTDLPWSERQWV